VFIDESWFVLWPYPAPGWAQRGRPRRIPQAKSWDRKHRPPSCALYAAMDTRERQVSAEWHPTWNQEETWAHLEQILASYQGQAIRSLVVFWDHGPWHVARSVREKIAAYNRCARQTGGMHVLLFYLPIKSPWLMPLEPVFGQTKRAIGGADYATLADLQGAVERRLQHRNIRVAERNRNHQLTLSTESN